MTLLAIDPSKRCTGLVVSDQDGAIMDFATFEFEKAKGMKATPEKMHFQSVYTRVLMQTIACFDIDRIVSEFPIGSQSATAAWYLGMVTQAITSVSLSSLGKEPDLVTPGDARKSILGDRNASKGAAIELAHKVLDNSYLKDEFGILPNYKQEAVADAIVIQQFFFSNLSTIENNVNYNRH